MHPSTSPDGKAPSTIELASKPSHPPSTAIATSSAAQPPAPPAPWSESLQAVLDQPPAALSSRLLLLGLLFGCVFGGWAWFGRIHEVSFAQGQLVPEGEAYNVQPMVPGEVAQILVDEGERVYTGQLIAALDTRLEMTEIERLEESLVAYQQQLAQAEILVEKTRLEGETRRAIATADITAQKVAVTEAEVNTNVLRQMLDHLSNETEAYEVRLSRLQPLVEAGAIAEDQLFQVEQALREQAQSMTHNQGDLEKNLAEVERLRAELTRHQAAGQQSQLELEQRLQQLEQEVSVLQAKVIETKALLKAAQTKLEQMHIYAPEDGTVLSLEVENPGEMVQAGQTIAAIAPDASPLVLSASLPSHQAGLVKEGLDVNIKFDAFPYQDYGVIPGTITSISPSTKSHEQHGSVYEVDVSLDRNYVTHENQRVSLKAGQTATAEIIIRQRRIIDILLDPIRQLQKGGINL